MFGVSGQTRDTENTLCNDLLFHVRRLIRDNTPEFYGWGKPTPIRLLLRPNFQPSPAVDFYVSIHLREFEPAVSISLYLDLGLCSWGTEAIRYVLLRKLERGASRACSCLCFSASFMIIALFDEDSCMLGEGLAS